LIFSVFRFDFISLLPTIRNMLKLFRSILILVSLLFSLESLSAASMPFTDVAPTDPYYSAVQDLYESRVITDN
jgi:hypothetical protein